MEKVRLEYVKSAPKKRWLVKVTLAVAGVALAATAAYYAWGVWANYALLHSQLDPRSEWIWRLP